MSTRGGSAPLTHRPQLELSCWRPTSVSLLLKPRGELDILTCPDLEHRIQEELVVPVELIVLDLSELTLLSARGIRLLCRLRARARASGFQLVIVGHLSRGVERSLRLTDVLPLLDTRESLDHALDV